jgi:hypothetical protein
MTQDGDDAHWTSTYHMLQRFFEMRGPVANTLTLLDDPRLQLLSYAEWDVVERACIFLTPLYEAAVEICSESYVSASKAVVMAKGLLKLCRNQLHLPGLPATIERMLSTMATLMEARFSNLEMNPLLAEVTLLDPRFKRSGFADSFAADQVSTTTIYLPL